jgi:hypothetical protein
MYRQISPASWGSLRYSINHTSTAGFLTKEILNRYDQLCEKSKDNKIKDNSIIYPSPLSNYPAYKLKNYIQENKLNITKARKWDKIDTIIIDKDFLSYFKTEKNKNYTLIPSKEILGNKDKYIGKDNWSYDRTNGFLDTVFFYVESESIKNNYKDFSQFEKYPQIEGFPIRRDHGHKNICDNIEFITELFDNIEKYNLHVVLDSSIDKEINKDTVIDLDIYETLYNMLNSTDEGNTKIAREIIANCEYEQSRPYILFLTSIFEKLLTKSDNKNYHAVYKHLNKERTYFDVWGYKTNGHFDVIQRILKKCPEYKSIFCSCAKLHLNTLYKSEIIKEVVPYIKNGELHST